MNIEKTMKEKIVINIIFVFSILIILVFISTSNSKISKDNNYAKNKGYIIISPTSNTEKIQTRKEVKITKTPEINKSKNNKKITETQKKLTANVKLLSANKTLNNTHVGHNWSYHVKINGKKIKLGEIISISGPINANVIVVEKDSIPDKGITRKKLVNGKNVINVVVSENRGRYSGESEVWQFVINVQ